METFRLPGIAPGEGDGIEMSFRNKRFTINIGIHSDPGADWFVKDNKTDRYGGDEVVTVALAFAGAHAYMESCLKSK